MKEELKLLRSHIGSKLRGLRAELKMSQENVAVKTGLNVATIIRYENASITQNLDKLLILADFYNVDLLYFFTSNYENFHRNK